MTSCTCKCCRNYITPEEAAANDLREGDHVELKPGAKHTGIYTVYRRDDDFISLYFSAPAEDFTLFSRPKEADDH